MHALFDLDWLPVPRQNVICCENNAISSLRTLGMRHRNPTIVLKTSAPTAPPTVRIYKGREFARGSHRAGFRLYWKLVVQGQWTDWENTGFLAMNARRRIQCKAGDSAGYTILPVIAEEGFDGIASLMLYCSTIPQTPEQRGCIATWLNTRSVARKPQQRPSGSGLRSSEKREEVGDMTQSSLRRHERVILAEPHGYLRSNCRILRDPDTIPRGAVTATKRSISAAEFA